MPSPSPSPSSSSANPHTAGRENESDFHHPPPAKPTRKRRHPARPGPTALSTAPLAHAHARSSNNSATATTTTTTTTTTATPSAPAVSSSSGNASHPVPPSRYRNTGGSSCNFFNLQNNSGASVASSLLLLDHRAQKSMKPRRSSTLGGSAAAFSTTNTNGGGGGGGGGGRHDRSQWGSLNTTSVGGSQSAGILPSAARRQQEQQRRRRGSRVERERFRGGLNGDGTDEDAWCDSSDNGDDGNNDEEEEEEDGESAPLMGSSRSLNERSSLFMGGRGTGSRPVSESSSRGRGIGGGGGGGGRRVQTANGVRDYRSINFPPSVPGSPRMDPHQPLLGLSGPMGSDEYDLTLRGSRGGDTIINIDGNAADERPYPDSSLTTPPVDFGPAHRVSTMRAEEDVCFPVDDGLTDDEVTTLHGGNFQTRRRRVREWPDLPVLEDWSREEKEERSEGIRAKKTSEPVLVGGRLRPNVRSQWHREEAEAPYRFTYFNDEFPATIHSHTISELVQPGQTFKDLFRPDPRVLEDSSDESEPEEQASEADSHAGGGGGATPPAENELKSGQSPPNSTPTPAARLGAKPTFWLDVFSPTDSEMKILSKAFGIHPLTAEDIMMQETREKVELFRSYYLVSYRTFEQDSNSENFLGPVNIYVVVFREGIISFHFSMTPHPANVRRRIRQLKDYITVSADWISYALIDDITDAFAPLIQNLEEEVDDIDDAILRLHVTPLGPLSSSSSSSKTAAADPDNEDPNPNEQKSDGDMLKRVGDTRKKVMGLYRLLGNKADVIKGFAKRCNEQWEVAPRSEIGLYLGDIQDHIITMVSNLNHMEKILSRSHSNYLAQINIKMNERQEQTADVLGRLTVLGTIVLPMNIITGLWGMNVLVPGQDVVSLTWFYCITAGLLVFGFLCYFIAKRVYKIM